MPPWIWFTMYLLNNSRHRSSRKPSPSNLEVVMGLPDCQLMFSSGLKQRSTNPQKTNMNIGKITIFYRKYTFKWRIFHCLFSFRGCILDVSKPREKWLPKTKAKNSTLKATPISLSCVIGSHRCQSRKWQNSYSKTSIAKTTKNKNQKTTSTINMWQPKMTQNQNPCFAIVFPLWPGNVTGRDWRLWFSKASNQNVSLDETRVFKKHYLLVWPRGLSGSCINLLFGVFPVAAFQGRSLHFPNIWVMG